MRRSTHNLVFWLKRPWVVLILLNGCSAGPKYLAKDFQPPETIAVLPFANETNDVQGPEIVRNLLISLLPRRGYFPMDQESVDKILAKKFGITEGGQLGVANAQDLGKALNADGLLYGNLLTFQDLPLGVVRKRTVKANLRLVDAKTGDILWEDQKAWTTPEVHFKPDEARRAAIAQVADRQMRKMNGTYLREESLLMLRLALDTLPSRIHTPSNTQEPQK